MRQLDSELDRSLTARAPKFFVQDNGDTFSSTDVRVPYQRDLGRIVHSASFRRLQAKTQVMGTGEGDFHRTRLTHSLEVAQIGRGLVWRLSAQLAEAERDFLPPSELMEAICYGHDLGHPPFGHGGEKALHKEMKYFGGFEGNAQTIRILTRLEKYYRGSGIRPTRRLLLGVLKYPVAYSEYGEEAYGRSPPKCFYDDDIPLIESALSIFSDADRGTFRALGSNGKPKFKNFDCSIMELADDIAYGVHDLEDGIGRSILRRDEVGDLVAGIFLECEVQKVFSISIGALIDKLFSRDPCERKHAISVLVSFFVEKVSVKNQGIFESKFLDLNVSIPEHARKILDFLSKRITFENVVKKREIQTLEFKGEKIISDLFNTFAEDPIALIGEENIEAQSDGLVKTIRDRSDIASDWRNFDDEARNLVARAISDFIASMTNPTAEKYHRRLFEPGYGSSTDEF